MRHFEIAIAIVYSQGRVLISQRLAEGSCPNVWEFPGGKKEANESAAQCAIREVREETDLTVEVVEPCATIEFAYPDRHISIHPFLCRLISGQAKPLAAQQVCWVLPSQLTDYTFPPANDGLIKQLQDRLSRLDECRSDSPPNGY